MSFTPGYDNTVPTPPSIQQYEIYTQNGPMALGAGLYLTVDGKIAVDAEGIAGVINGGTF